MIINFTFSDIFGSLRSEDYNSTSLLPQAQRVIQRPIKASRSDPCLQQEHSPSRSSASSRDAVPIQDDLHFPKLPSKLSVADRTSSLSTQSSQLTIKSSLKKPPSDPAILLSHAQNAYQQQFDDAEGAQRWEKCKQQLSEHYLGNFKERPESSDSVQEIPSLETSPLFADDSSILQAGVARPRSHSGRSFPVRLLSNSPDDAVDLIEQATLLEVKEEPLLDLKELQRINSADLDETVLKCIYEVEGDLLTENEIAKSTGLQRSRETVTEAPTSTSHEPMTLPTIGFLSANAAEFVPRPKPVTTASTTNTTTTTQSTPPQLQPLSGPSSKVSKSNAVEIKPGVKNSKQRTSPTVLVGSPLTVSTPVQMGSPLALSPSISPGLSPPGSGIAVNPMFITPKYQGLFNTIQRPQGPPAMVPAFQQSFISTSPAPRIPPPGPNAAYRFPTPSVGTSFPYAPRVVFSVAPPQRYHMPGMPAHYVTQQSPGPAPPQLTTKMPPNAAMVTGQPIMATREGPPQAQLPGAVYMLPFLLLRQLNLNGFVFLIMFIAILIMKSIDNKY